MWLLRQAVQRGLVGAATFVVDRGAIGRPLGLPGDGLHALLTFRPRGLMVRSGARRLNRRWWRLHRRALIRVRAQAPCRMARRLRWRHRGRDAFGQA